MAVEEGSKYVRWARAAVARASLSGWLWQAGLVAALLLGLALRFHGLDWDQPEGAGAPLHMHPDERHIALVSSRLDWPSSLAEYFDTARNPLNPYNAPETPSFVYGSVPLYLGKGLSALAGDDPPGPGNSYGADVVWGRRLTALADALTILATALVAALLFGRPAGVIAALLYALSVFPTQLAHFWTVDPYLTFFATAALAASIAAVPARARWYFLLLGVVAPLFLALAVASKVSGAMYLLLLPAAVACRLLLRRGVGFRWGGRTPDIDGSTLLDLAVLPVAAAVAFVAFRVSQPFAFSGPGFLDVALNQQWLDDIRREMEFQSGRVDYPPFVQFADRTPFLDPFLQIVLWGLGLPVGLASLAGLAAASALACRRRDLAWALPLLILLVTFGYYGRAFVNFMRYFEPVYPVLVIAAAWAVCACWGLASALGKAGALARPAARAAAVVAVAGAIAWAAAFQAVYGGEHPRIAASEWIYEHVPPGSVLTFEYWDDALPYPLPGRDAGAYELLPLDLYRTDSIDKIFELVRALDFADYVVLSSDRVRSSVPKLEREYPATIRYYELLENGSLGFELAATFTLRPSLLGFRIDDSGAEESFTVYDHPRVRIFRKTERWDAARALEVLLEAHPERAVNLLPAQGRTNGLLFTAREAAERQAQGSFDEAFHESVLSRLPALSWILWLQLPALLALGLTTWLLPRSPAAAHALGKVFGLLAPGLVAWIAVAWEAAGFSSATAWASWSLVVGALAAIAWRRRSELRRVVRSSWPELATVEVCFLLAFGWFLALRWFNPDLWHDVFGGEKPMELSYFTAIVRSAELPPYDPWFAGGSMNYYYLGWFLAAVPTRALGLLPEVAFNLALPTFAGLAAAAEAGAAAAVVSLARRPWPRRWLLVSAALSTYFLVFAGNLDAAHQLVERLQAVSSWRPLEGVPVLGGAGSLAGGIFAALVRGAELPPFDWWRSSRVHFGSFDITEFPYWSFLFADLHPHLMDTPFFSSLALLAAGFVTAATGREPLRAVALGALLGLWVAFIRAAHTWDFPTAALLAAGSFALSLVLGARWRTVAWAGLAALAAYLIPLAPFSRAFETFGAGLQRAPETTPPQQFVAHFGAFLAVGALYLAVRVAEARKDVVPLPLAARPWDVAGLVLLGTGFVALSHRLGYGTVALGIVLISLFALLLFHEVRQPFRDGHRIATAALFAFATAVAVGVDVVTLENDIVRMNTVFKFSFQAWQLYAVASGLAAAVLLRGFAGALRRPGGRARYVLVCLAGGGLAGALLFATSAYIWQGTPARQSVRFDPEIGPTLNGFAFLPAGTFREDRGTQDPTDDVTLRLAEDWPLAQWLRSNVTGTPVIVEAPAGLYHWTARFSMLTGLPNVVGWDWHETQQRWDYASLVAQRVADTRSFWTNPDPSFARWYLWKYDVGYVVVGTTERALAQPSVLAMLDQLPELRPVFRIGEARIYAVERGALRDAMLATLLQQYETHTPRAVD